MSHGALGSVTHVTEFMVGAFGLFLLAGAFILVPHWFQRRSADQPGASEKQDNLDWYRLRESELATDEAQAELLDDAGLRLLEDGVNALPEETAAQPAREAGQLGWLLVPLAAFATLAYLQLGAMEDVRLSGAIQTLGQQPEPAQVHALMAEISQRAQQRPDNLHYRAILGRYYMSIEDYNQAAMHYQALVNAAPNDASALAMAAQANYLANNRVLDDNSQMLAERALNQNPHERSALGLLGMSAFERGQYRAAIAYWERLLAVEAPGSEGAQLIESVIARARVALQDGSEASAELAAVADEPHITIDLALPEGEDLDPQLAVYVFARNSNSESRMPVAVQRLRVADLPTRVRLDDQASMAGQKLSQLQAVQVIARVSADGQPGEASALYSALLDGLAPAADEQVYSLTLSPVSP